MIVKIIVVLLVILLIEAVCEFLYKKTYSYKKSQEQTERLKKIPNNLEVVNIGSGPAYYGFDYKYCEKHGYNLATAPQNFVYGYRLLRKNEEKIKEGAIILITVMAPMSFGENKDIYRADYSDKFYGVLTSKDIDNYSVFRWLIILYPFMTKICKKIRYIFNKKSINREIKTVVDIWIHEFDLTNLQDESQALKHRKTFNEKICLVREMIEYCYSRRWQPVLVIPPIPEVTRMKISNRFLEMFIYNNIYKILENYPKLRCLDYYDDTLFDDSCFMNSIFLNEKGKEIFSKKVFEDIGINGGE